MATKKRTVRRAVPAPAPAPQKKDGVKKGFAIAFLIFNILLILAGACAVIYGGAIMLLAVGLASGTWTSGLLLGTGLVAGFIYIGAGILAIIIGSIICRICRNVLRNLRTAKAK